MPSCFQVAVWCGYHATPVVEASLSPVVMRNENLFESAPYYAKTVCADACLTSHCFVNLVLGLLILVQEQTTSMWYRKLPVYHTACWVHALCSQGSDYEFWSSELCFASYVLKSDFCVLKFKQHMVPNPEFWKCQPPVVQTLWCLFLSCKCWTCKSDRCHLHAW